MANNNPGFIKNYPLMQVKGYYRVDSVEEFRKQAYNAYAECYARNKELAENFRKVEKILEEYKDGKDRIATTMMAATAYSAETKQKADAEAKEIVEAATDKANEILEDKKAQADSYYAEKTKQGDEYYSKAKTAYDDVMAQANAKAQEYIDSINEQAEQTVKKANETAALIVSRAYEDAQKARDAVDEILQKANSALPKAKNDLAKFKLEVSDLTRHLESLLSKIEVPDDLDIKNESEEIKQEVKMDDQTKLVFEVPVEPEEETTQQTQENSAQSETDDSSFLSLHPEFFSEPIADDSDVDIFSDSKNAPKDENATNIITNEGETASDYLFDRFSSLQTNILSDDGPNEKAADFSNLFNN